MGIAHPTYMFRTYITVLELAVGFGLFWLGQLAYQKLFRRRMELNIELFVRDNPAVAIALVGYYFGIVIALGGVLGQAQPLGKRRYCLWQLMAQP